MPSERELLRQAREKQRQGELAAEQARIGRQQAVANERASLRQLAQDVAAHMRSIGSPGVTLVKYWGHKRWRTGNHVLETVGWPIVDLNASLDGLEGYSPRVVYLTNSGHLVENWDVDPDLSAQRGNAAVAEGLRRLPSRHGG